MIFRNTEHENKYRQFFSQMKSRDEYRQMVAYLLSLDTVLADHAEDVFNFSEDCIIPESALKHGWQTGTSRKTTRLLLNLWNGWCDDEGEGEERSTPSEYTPYNIFSCEYGSYYFEAIKILFGVLYVG